MLPSTAVWAAWGCGDSSGEADNEEVANADCSPGSNGVSAIAHAKKSNPTCPPPTQKLGSQCVIKKDVILSEPLVLAPNTKLNCQGHSILPSGVSPGPNIQSVPEIAIFAARASGLKIQNCTVGSETNPFSFGIMIADSLISADTHPGELALRRNKILNNTVFATGIAVDLLQTDNSEVSDNSLIIFGNGFGVDIRRGARNVVNNNDIERIDALYRPKALFPGGVPIPAPLVFTAGIIEGTGPNPTAPFSFSIGGESVTIPAVNPALFPAPKDTIIEGNTVEMTGIIGRPASLTSFQINTGIEIEDGANGTIVRGNTVTGSPTNPPVLGMIITGGSAGIGLHAYNVSVEHNTFSGAFIRDAVQVFLAHDTTVSANSFSGGGRSGILLSSFGLESSVVTRNAIFENGFNCVAPFCTTAPLGLGGFSLARGTAASNFASFYGAELSLNDVTDNFRGVGVITLVPYTFPSELSVNGQGNYWGHSNSPGFLPVDSGLYPMVKDSNPYCSFVAELDANSLPPICP